jgi:hypothetical protein
MDRTQNTHGTVYSYIKLGCKCPACRLAWSSYMADYRRGRQQKIEVPARTATVDIDDLSRRTAKIRREQDITRAINQQNNTDKTSDIAGMTMLEWAKERGQYMKTRDTRTPGQDMF